LNEWTRGEKSIGERDKLESISTHVTEICAKVSIRVTGMCITKEAKTAEVYHVPQWFLQSTFLPFSPFYVIVIRYFERANPSGKVGWLGKRLTDLSGATEFVHSYVMIEEILRARTTNFVEQAYISEICCIDMLQNEPQNIDGDGWLGEDR
jgi:hypothetical protein